MNEIIDELIVFSEKMGNPQFRDVLQKCKNETNKKILSLLQKFNQDYIEYVGREFVEIKDFAIEISHLTSLTRRDNYNSKLGVLLYQIIVNEDAQEKIMNCNITVDFSSVVSRDNEYNSLKERLLQSNVVFL